MKPDKAMFQTMKTASHDRHALRGPASPRFSWRQRGLGLSNRISGWKMRCPFKCRHLEDSVRHPFLGKQPHGCHQRDQPGNFQSLLQHGLHFWRHRGGTQESSSRDLVVHPGSSSSSAKECEFLAFVAQPFLYMFRRFFYDNFGYIVKSCYFFGHNESPLRVTEQMKNLVSEAKGAQERLYSSAMRMLTTRTSIKPFATQLKDWIQKNDHFLT